MIVALDIDDTITRHPAFFSVVTRALVAAGSEVIILTFREDAEAVAAELAGWGIAYTDIVTSTTKELFAHGTDEWKAHVCRQRGVEILFDDMAEILQHVDESVVAFLAIDRRRHRLDLLADDMAPPEG